MWEDAREKKERIREKEREWKTQSEIGMNKKVCEERVRLRGQQSGRDFSAKCQVPSRHQKNDIGFSKRIITTIIMPQKRQKKTKGTFMTANFFLSFSAVKRNVPLPYHFSLLSSFNRLQNFDLQYFGFHLMRFSPQIKKQ